MLKGLVVIAGFMAAVAVIDGNSVWANQGTNRDEGNSWSASVNPNWLANQPAKPPQPSGAELLQQGGTIEDKATPLQEPGPNLQRDDAILQQESELARQQSVSDIIRQAQDQDLVTDDYVGNPNYFQAWDGQQFGDEGFWAWPGGFEPYTLGF